MLRDDVERLASVRRFQHLPLLLLKQPSQHLARRCVIFDNQERTGWRLLKETSQYGSKSVPVDRLREIFCCTECEAEPAVVDYRHNDNRDVDEIRISAQLRKH